MSHNEGGPAGTLERALAEAGYGFHVEARGNLAVVTPSAGAHRVLSDEERREVLGLARAHGFTHAALEIPESR